MVFNTFGGDKRDRTADLLNAIQALSQLSYTPIYPETLEITGFSGISKKQNLRSARLLEYGKNESREEQKSFNSSHIHHSENDGEKRK